MQLYLMYRSEGKGKKVRGGVKVRRFTILLGSLEWVCMCHDNRRGGEGWSDRVRITVVA